MNNNKKIKKHRQWVLAFFIWCLVFILGYVVLPFDNTLTNPQPIVDEASLFALEDQHDKKILADYSEFMRSQFDIDLRVHTSVDTGDINIDANQRFHLHQVGTRSKMGRGLLLLVNPKQDQVRFEVGYELEPYFTDAFVAYIEQRQMVPFFRNGKVLYGILATVEMIVTRAQFGLSGKEEIYQPWLEGSGGAGATTQAYLHQPKDIPTRIPPSISQAFSQLDSDSTPRDILDINFKKLELGVNRFNLPIYSEASRTAFAEKRATPAQIDNTLRIYKRCSQPELFESENGQYAVLRYKTHERLCMPYFFKKEYGIWRIDAIAIGYGLRNNFSNEWYFDGDYENNILVHPYLFAFKDWYVTKKGRFYMYRWQLEAESHGQCDNRPFQIIRVVEKMGADQLGLQVGDIPVRFLNEKIQDRCHFMRLLRKPKNGELVTMTVDRGGELVTLTGHAPSWVGNMAGPQDKRWDQFLALWSTSVPILKEE